MKILKPYRDKIDAIDQEIIGLLRRRYDVIEEVGHLKSAENIPSVIQARVDEVRKNAERMAAEQGLDAKFIGTLYAQLIEHSCNTEEEIICALRQKKAKG